MKMRHTAFLIAAVCCILISSIMAAAGTVQPAAESGPEISELLDRMGQRAAGIATVQTRFVQVKDLALFQDKLVLKGRVYLQKPDRIAWHVDDPVRYSVLITDTVVRQWDGETDRVRELSVADNPVLQSVLGQLKIWFAGEYSEMLRDYRVKVLEKDPLVLVCVPRDTSIARKVIRTITLTFRTDMAYLRQIVILENSGDTTTITFSDTLLNAPLENGNFQVRPGSSSSLIGGEGRLSQRAPKGRSSAGKAERHSSAG